MINKIKLIEDEVMIKVIDRTETDTGYDKLVGTIEAVWIKGETMGFKLNNESFYDHLLINVVSTDHSFTTKFYELPRKFKDCKMVDGREVVTRNETTVYLYGYIALGAELYRNGGVSRESYAGMEVNHKDGSGACKRNSPFRQNIPANLEIVGGTENSLHDSAMEKLYSFEEHARFEKYRFSFSACNEEFIRYVISKGADLSLKALQDRFDIMQVDDLNSKGEATYTWFIIK